MANKLELTWYGKDEPIRVEPRLLIENPALSNVEKDADTGNMLIHGDNLLALKALEAQYAGQVKCIYIDPPYNTGAAFEHYDDNLEHSIWLNLMYERIKILHRLLSEDGCLWISIDNTEGHYLKVICDEIFTRKNFVADITYEKSNVSGLGQGGAIVNTGEKLLVYKKDTLSFNEVLGTERLALKTMKRYSTVKQLCSVDDIFAEKKYKDPFSFSPSHSLVLYTNHLPRVSASDDGTWRRLIVIPFNAKIEGKSDIKNYGGYLYQNAAESILAWIIEGAKKVIDLGYKFPVPANMSHYEEVTKCQEQ